MAVVDAEGECVVLLRICHLTVLVLSLALVNSTVQAQEWARKMFETTSHDFGAVARGAKIEYRFLFENIYEEDVHIANVRSSCGCTTPDWNKEAIKTFEKGEILAVFNTRSFLGSKNATLTVTFDKPFYAEVQLQISGYIRSDVVLSPGSVDFGSVDHGTAAERKIAINYAGRNDWKVVDVRSANPHLEAELVETKRGGGLVSYELLVRLMDNAPTGYINDQLLVQTNDTRATQFPIDVEGRVVSDVTVSPSPLFLGVMQSGEESTKRLVVRGRQKFRITEVTCDDCLKLEVDDEARLLHLIPVTMVAGNTAGKSTHKIQLKTDLPGDMVIEVQAYAQINE